MTTNSSLMLKWEGVVEGSSNEYHIIMPHQFFSALGGVGIQLSDGALEAMGSPTSLTVTIEVGDTLDREGDKPEAAPIDIPPGRYLDWCTFERRAGCDCPDKRCGGEPGFHISQCPPEVQAWVADECSLALYATQWLKQREELSGQYGHPVAEWIKSIDDDAYTGRPIDLQAWQELRGWICDV